MDIAIAIIAAYLLGAIPFGFIIGKVFGKIDIRQHGSGNIGATNVSRVMGKKWWLPCFLLDMGKGLLPVALAAIFFKDRYAQFPYHLIMIALTIMPVIGHNWTCFLGFKGGKGVATSLGAVLGLCVSMPYLRFPLLLAAATWGLLMLVFRLVSLGSISASAVFMLFCVFGADVPNEFKILAVFIALFIVIRHQKNFAEIHAKFAKKSEK
jgi:glycerol-3-phosphate acyltransferase PlsY